MPVRIVDQTFLTGLLEACAAPVLAFDGALRYTVCTPAAERALGIPAALVLGREAAELAPPDRREAMVAEHRRALAGDRFVVPAVALGAGGGPGATAWDLSYAPIRAADETIVGGVLTLTAATPAPDAPGDADVPLLRAILDALPDALVAYDGALRVVEWNAATARNNGVDRAAAVGRGVLDLFPYIRGTAIEEEHRRSLAGEVVDGRDRCWTPTGGERPRWYDVTYLPLRDGAQAVVGGVVVTADVTARREARDALTRERRLLRTVVDAAPFGLTAFDAELCITEWNAHSERLTGIRRADAVGRPILELLPDLAATDVLRDYERALAGETVRVRERWYEGATGRRCYDAVFAPMHDGRGAVIGGVMLAIDVTERAVAERTVAESEARYRQFFDEGAAMQVVIDGETMRVADANAPAVAFYGYPREALVGMPVERLLDAPPTERDGCAPFPASGAARVLTQVLASGERRVVEVYATPMTRGGREYFHTAMHDVTDRVRAEDERDRLIRIIEATPDIVATGDPRTRRVVSMNRGGRELLGIAPDETELEMETFIAEDDRALVFGEALPTAAREGTWHGELRLRARDGRVIPVSAVVIAHQDALGATAFVSTICRDITARKRHEAEQAAARESAEAASRAKSSFLAGLSHELRTPLGAVIGFAQILRDAQSGSLSATQREYLDDVLAGAHHLRVVVDDALDLARIEAGVIDVRPRPVDLRAIVAEVLVTVAPSAAAAGVALRHDVADDAADVVTDPARVRQVLLNLLTNAVKFNRAGGMVHVEAAAAPGDRVRLSVRDTGRGIAAADLPRLFQEFQRLGERDVPGSGLGLAITQRVVEAMGGTVAVESEPGAGSTFHALLPRAPLRADEAIADAGGAA